MAGPVPGFVRVHGEFWCDEVALSAVAETTGTPTHVYSRSVLRERYVALDAAFGDYPHDLHYAIKANATLAVVREMKDAGAHADANSGGEIEVALRVGFTPDQIVFTGVGKTHDELVRAVTLGLKAINAESPGEVERIQAIAKQSQGFIYLVSVTGVTGIRSQVATRVEDLIVKIHEVTDKPVGVGFGISQPEQALQMKQWGADAVIVGSAFVKRLAEGTPEEGLKSIELFCRELKAAII